MITEHEEIARHRVAEHVRAAEARSRRREDRPARTSSPRHGLATALRRLADRLEPASRRLSEPQPRHRGTGLSIVR